MFKHEHYTMEHIAEYTTRAKQQQDVSFTGKDPAALWDGVQVDGLWLCKSCAEIVGELRKKMPDLKIGANRDTRNWNAMLSDVVVYREGEPYALGRIGHGDVGINHTDYKYYVLSRNLRKARGGWGRWQNYIKASAKMSLVLSVAKKALVSYAMHEIAGHTIDDFTKTVRYERNRAGGNVSSAWRDIVQGSEGEELKAELIAMVRDGYKFVNHKITARIEAYINAIEVKTEADNKQLNAYFVHISPDKTEIVEYENMGDTSKSNGITKVNTRDIPFDLQLKIASLQVATSMNYIEDLGMRVGDRTFWVQR